MVEIRIHGRGGQGNVMAAYLLASAAFYDGKFSQAFPSFGAERRGAPITAFVRLDERPILRRSQVIAPQALLLQDDGLLHISGTLSGLPGDGSILVNSPHTPEALRKRLEEEGRPLSPSVRLLAIPATRLSLEVLGRPIPNTPLLAAFLALTEMVSLDSLIRALSDRFSGDLLTMNKALVGKGAGLVAAGKWRASVHA